MSKNTRRNINTFSCYVYHKCFRIEEQIYGDNSTKIGIKGSGKTMLEKTTDCLSE